MPASQTDLETRRENALRRLGTRSPACAVCGMSDWRCIEAHHIAGKAHHDQTTLLCRNCHRKATDDQKDHPADIGGQDVNLAMIGHYLMGLADLFRMIAETLLAFGKHLVATAQADSSPNQEK